jgi:hypothetical protein
MRRCMMADRKNGGVAKKISDDYCKLIGEAHINNMLDMLNRNKDEINKMQISERFDKWIRGFIAEIHKKT